jgi:hypothetical protein
MLCANPRFSVSIGCKETRFADINVDIDEKCRPDIVADALCLPLRSGIFSRTIFSDVIEHLPMGTEPRALSEISRILGYGGELILTTPNDQRLFTILDPARYVVGHRHYGQQEVLRLVESTGFQVVTIFASGGVWEMLSLLFYYAVVFPISRILKCRVGANPFSVLEDKDYDRQGAHGYTIFLKAVKR